MKCASYKRRCRKCGLPNVPRVSKCRECGEDLKCGRDAVVGYRLCMNHGGPVASRKFYGVGRMKNGSTSSFKIMRLAAKYNQMQNDGRLLSNRAAIEIIDTRIKELLDRVDVKDAPERVSLLYSLWQDYEKYLDDGNSIEAVVTRKKISEAFEKTYHDYQGWKQIFEALDLRGKSVEREIKTITAIKAIMTAEEGYELVAKVAAITIRLIGENPSKLKEAQYEFARLIGESSDNATKRIYEEAGSGGDTGGGEEGFGEVDQEEFLHTGDAQ